MIEIIVPGFKTYNLKNLIIDFNGTLAKDGYVENEILDNLRILSKKIKIYILSADTHGNVRKIFQEEPVEIVITSKENGTDDKYEFLKSLDIETTATIGNGRIDRKMLEKAKLSICVMGEEGCAKSAFENSDVIVNSRLNALELFVKPTRLIATLRG